MNGGRLGPRQLPYNIPVQAIGTDFEVSPGDFSIARLAIDNPSQCWLYLSQINTYIPPQTLSRIVSVNPTQTRVLVSFVNAPTGGVPSVATGDPIQVIAYDTDAPDVAGTDFGLLPAVIDLTAEIQTLITAIEQLKGGWGAATDVLYLSGTATATGAYTNMVAAPGSGFRIVADMVSVTWGVNATLVPRGYLSVTVGYDSGNTPIGGVTLEPGNLFAPIELIAGGAKGGANEPLQVIVFPTLDTADSIIEWFVAYHVEAI